jgi:hypothetical protein
MEDIKYPKQLLDYRPIEEAAAEEEEGDLDDY